MDSIEILALGTVALLLVVAVLAVATEEAFRRLGQNRVVIEDVALPRRAAKLERLRSDPLAASTLLRLLAIVPQIGQTTTVAFLAVRWLSWPWVLVVVVVNVFVVFILAEVVPRMLAILNPKRWALVMAGTVSLLLGIWPVRLFVGSLVTLSSLMVPGRRLNPFSPAEELIALADAALEEDELAQNERDLIQSAIKFGDTVVREVMIPRPDIFALEQTLSVAEALERAHGVGFSRLPLQGDSSDDLIGLVYVKDLIKAELDGAAEASVSDYQRDAFYVPETKRGAKLLQEMQQQQTHMAIAIDEYGGVAGLVTMEDLIEELVGEIVDEYDMGESLVQQQQNGALRVDGRIGIDELNELATLDLPEGDWDTVAGLVVDQFGRIPRVGEECQVGNCIFHVDRLQGRRITHVIVTVSDLNFEEVDVD